MKKIKMTFEFEVRDEESLRAHFRQKFAPPTDADDCHVGYFGLCAVEDGFHPIPGVKLIQETMHYEKS